MAQIAMGEQNDESRSLDKVEGLFARALDQPPDRRIEFVRRECEGDEYLRREVESLLSHHEARDFLTQAPIGAIWSLLGGEVSSELEDDIRENQEVGPYHVLRRLGEGGMGAVYLARQDEPIRRHLALKVLKVGIDSDEVVARFDQERQALALMNHPGIARVFDAGSTEDGRPYFVMEYVKGTPITRYCDRERLSIRERLRLFVRVCEAIQHAHQKGIIHRDIKPSNILIDEEVEVPHPKVIDFGVAKAIDEPLTDRTLRTRVGSLLGTPAFMSPEQLRPGKAGIDTRSDVYALGVLLYQLLVGALPISHESGEEMSIVEMCRLVCEEVPPAPSSHLRRGWDRLPEVAVARGTDVKGLWRVVRGELDWIVLKALEKEPHRRYASVSELVADIARYLRGEPVLAGPPSQMYRMRKFVRRNRLVVAAAGLAVTALVMGFAVSTYLYLQNRRASRLAGAQRDEILRLSDGVLLRQYLAEADSLWPVHPGMIPRLESWLVKAEELRVRLPLHRRKLAGIAARVEPLGSTGSTEASLGGAGLVFSRVEEQFEFGLLRDLVEGLERFLDPDPAVGAIANVRERLSFARSVERLSIGDHQEEWKVAVASIADCDGCPVYGGLEISPQLGLVPLGQNRTSGLWEFAHIQTGVVPRRDERGELIVTEETGLVFVLLPGGEFRMGAERPGGDHPLGSSNVDPLAAEDEQPVHLVCLGPFFMSKYEMTQGQWLRFTHTNPSKGKPGTRVGEHVHDLRHPVEQVSWDEADRVMRQLGLLLPTEAQWEYAARAGTHTVWWTGNDSTALQYAANLADQTCHLFMPPAWWTELWDDGWADTAPVGSFRPNPFGLHDVIGNVWEWCRDCYGSYELPVTGPDALRTARSERRVCRGGGYALKPDGCRMARREGFFPENTIIMGVRPTRSVK